MQSKNNKNTYVVANDYREFTFQPIELPDTSIPTLAILEEKIKAMNEQFYGKEVKKFSEFMLQARAFVERDIDDERIHTDDALNQKMYQDALKGKVVFFPAILLHIGAGEYFNFGALSVLSENTASGETGILSGKQNENLYGLVLDFQKKHLGLAHCTFAGDNLLKQYYSMIKDKGSGFFGKEILDVYEVRANEIKNIIRNKSSMQFFKDWI